jgi:hypothetical protein
MGFSINIEERKKLVAQVVDNYKILIRLGINLVRRQSDLF